ncbi:protease complex subunit PrcB family protein [Bernardetia sp. ABR2-2B]|uniref:protease complex subunit PrcB family protein n=1 Tax=Bernardetia sp. ABR2-2B TaxID=3127472 RepID=UPI0030D04F48
MKFISLFVFSILCSTFLSCKSSKDKQENKSIPFETVLKTMTFGSETKGTKIVQAQTDLKGFEIANGNDMPKELLEVDLKTNTLLMVMSGMKNTGGFDIEIEKIIEANDKITVFYKEINPEKGAMLTMALTYPLHAVTIKKTEKEIIFEEIKADIKINNSKK